MIGYDKAPHMKKVKVTLYGKFLLLAATLEGIMLLIVLVSLFSNHAKDERDAFRRVQALMLESYGLRADFSKKRDTVLAENFHSLMMKNDSILTPFIAKEDAGANRLLNLQTKYHEIFEEYLAKTKIRGLNEDSGLEGKFRRSVHDIEDIFEKTDSYELYVEMLQARRSEKDFIMRRRPQYIKKVERAIGSLDEKVERTPISASRKEEIKKLSENYLTNFHKLVEIFDELSRLERRLADYEKRIQNELNKIVRQKEERSNVAQTAEFIFVGVSLALGVLLSIFIARSITRPVVTLQQAAHKIAEGDLNTRVEVKTRDEVADLAASFNLMVDNIRASNETIVRQKNVLEDKNEELNTLAEDLRMSYEDLSFLSKIGRSITSTLDFDELFDKLFANLSEVIDYWAFGIGLYDDEKERINYRLIIRRDQKGEPFSVDASAGGRLDAMCLTYKQEIFIDNLGKKIAGLQKDYPWLESADEFVGLEPDSMSVIYLPITVEGKIVGVLSVENKRKHAYKKGHLDMLRNLASYVAIAIMNAKSYEELTKAHEDLKQAQRRLVQSEKMASLGRLSAGIAHEIKNPLNFIKNYAEGTSELCDELNEDLVDLKEDIGPKEFEFLSETVADIRNYLETIVKNSKRIDGIVKSMTAHARGSVGEKEPTDLNKFIKEYVKLAYNGFRGQYKDFVANFEHNLDESLGEVPVIRPELSRVLTNLADNGCYSTMKKKEKLNGSFEPRLTISTKDVGDFAEIRVRDNGLGIPKKALDKMFEPFFTTKPTGEGTGLGLSLSYDIIAGGHGGAMKAETVEGEFAEFIITIPKN